MMPATRVEPPDASEQPEAITNPQLTQWAKSGDRVYYAVGEVSRTLPAGAYTIHSHHDVIYFHRFDIKLSGLIRFPDTISDEIVKEIQSFWGLGDRFHRYELTHRRGILTYGPAGCISGDTHIGYVAVDDDGVIINKKGGTLRRLYRRFNDLTPEEKYTRWRRASAYYVQSVTDDGRIFRNAIRDVVNSGRKEVFRVTTLSGKTLEATADHEFLTGDGYRRLALLRVGNSVCINPGKTQSKGGRRRRPYRPEVFVKYHPTAAVKIVNGCRYYRLRVYQAVYEASMNDLTYDEYIRLLNGDQRAGDLWVIPDGAEIHHRDENPNNNDLSNLTLIESAAQHQRLFHSDVAVQHVAIKAELDEIVAIRPVGITDVYDIVCADPYRNFIAGGVAVHNCGKSCTNQLVAADVIERGGIVVPFPGARLFLHGMEVLRTIQPTTPVVVLMEDLDSLLDTPDSSEIMNVLDGTFATLERVVFLADTNYPERLERRVTNRPSRFDRCFEMKLPSSETRQLYLKSLCHQDDHFDIVRAVRDSGSFSFAHLKELFTATVIFGRDYETTVKDLRAMIEQRLPSGDDLEAVGRGPMGLRHRHSDEARTQ
jgi:hypothetical protein